MSGTIQTATAARYRMICDTCTGVILIGDPVVHKGPKRAICGGCAGTTETAPARPAEWRLTKLQSKRVCGGCGQYVKARTMAWTFPGRANVRCESCGVRHVR